MTDLMVFDGSQGEGGGQILRTVVGIAAATGRPVRMENIRAGRSRPGLMRQHLTAMQAAARVCNAVVTGAELRSMTLTFEPQQVCPGHYEFSIGTAGSASLVLQTVLPALMTAAGPSQLVLEGGTHNQWAPPFDFLTEAWLPLLERMGPRVTARLERHGFYPAGGGRMVVSIEPSSVLQGFSLTERGEIQQQQARILITNLPLSIARREADVLLRRLSLNQRDVAIDALKTPGPGNVVMLKLVAEHVTELFTGFGRQGTSAEQVAQGLVRELRRYLTAEVPVGEYLADQLMLPLSLSAAQNSGPELVRGGCYLTLPLSRHSSTQMEILQRLLPVTISTTAEPRRCLITISPM
ncbi:MAG: RNA 3'-terminal phosphate cyclase [Planctomycetaceae bacterium]|nr:RNA 3'-terminal phosphate cyclase [Planctomycetaceae bacterium]